MGLYAKIDCALTRDPKMIAVGLQGRLLYIQAVLYCRENLTDGVIDTLLLPLVAVDIPTPAKHMNRLAEVGALEKIDCGWRIPDPVWRRYNPTKSEVAELRREEAERKAAWRDKKRRDATVPTGQNGLSQEDRKVALGHRDGQPEGEPEPEGEGEGENSLSRPSYLGTPPTDPDERERISNVLKAVFNGADDPHAETRRQRKAAAQADLDETGEA